MARQSGSDGDRACRSGRRVGLALPDDDLSFLRASNGGEGELSAPPLWLVLNDAAFVTQRFCDASARAFFPDLLVIGSNGAGEAIAFDLRDGAAGGIVCFDMTSSDLSESVQPVAASFMDLMALVVATGDCPPAPPPIGTPRRCRDADWGKAGPQCDVPCAAAANPLNPRQFARSTNPNPRP